MSEPRVCWDCGHGRSQHHGEPPACACGCREFKDEPEPTPYTPTPSEWEAMKRRAESAEAQAAAMLFVEKNSDGTVSHIARVEILEKGRALLSRLRALEAVAEAARRLMGCEGDLKRVGSTEELAAMLEIHQALAALEKER